MLVFKNIYALILLFAFILYSCNNKREPYKSPKGYDLNTPEKFVMKEALKEISGITFLNGDYDTMYAIEDESGRLYSFTPGSKKLSYSSFKGRGDFEDVTDLNGNTIAILESNGSILLMPAPEIGQENMNRIQEYKKLLPEGEYEGLFAAGNKLFVLCKNCSGDKGAKEVSVFVLEQVNGALLSHTNSFKVDISMVKTDGEKGKAEFHPSCLSMNPVTKEWYIISAVNKVLVILDEQWKLKEFYPLDPSLFKQPEGLTFNNKGDMYISNEGARGSANILLFRYRDM